MESKKMEDELVAKCECCGLKEDCTQDYIREVKAKFDGKWLCGLCSVAVTDELNRGKKPSGVGEAVKAHMSFCRKDYSNPAVQVADGMKEMLRRRSGDFSSDGMREMLRRRSGEFSSSQLPPSSSSTKYMRSQVGDEWPHSQFRR